MRKAVIHKPGGYDQLKIESAPLPVPGPGQVLIKSHAAGVNYADVCVRWGVYASAKEFVGWPITPGFEFSGKVAALGERVEKFRLGDEVFGVSFFGAYATHLLADTDLLWHRPLGLSPLEAAGMPAVFLTAYHGLFQSVPVRKGMKVLVHSAAGGVGSSLVQMAKIHGLEVTGVVGASHKLSYLNQIGCDHGIDKSSEDLWKRAKEIAPEGFDLIYDANGPETLRESYAHLRPTGKLVCYGFHTLLPKKGGRINYLKAAWGMLRMPRFNPLRMTTDNKSVIAFNLSFLFARKDLLREAMSDILRWLEEGKLRAPKVQAFALTECGKAHAALESGTTVGKLVLKMDD
jgi:NADPH:quinone reductase-like Zn-dependent oxidoreductase